MTKKIAIIGAGPSGLSCALLLAREGYEITLIEKAPTAGGLMRNIKWEKYQVDLGRKELYTRLNAVNDFWVDLLGEEYREYDYHVGFLYNKRVLEKTASYKGPFRGMPILLIVQCIADFIKWRLFGGRPRNYEQFAAKSRGKKFNMVFSQGFFEKFDGRLWKDLDVPEKDAKEVTQMSTTQSMKKFFTTAGDEKTGQEKWRHPRYGAGQITDAIKSQLDEYNVQYLFKSSVEEVIFNGDSIEKLKIKTDEGALTINPDVVVSSVPLEFAGKLFLNEELGADVKRTSLNRGAIIVYLFLDEPTRFPHTWLNVSDQNYRIGRIVNYANFGGEMVPEGKTCLCVEFFLFSDDELFKNENEELLKIALDEVESAGLIDRKKLEHHMVFKLPHANAAVSWKDYLNEPHKEDLYQRLKDVPNLYNVNRAGTDRATHAGIEAAHAIINSNKERFEKLSDPRLKEPWDQIN